MIGPPKPLHTLRFHQMRLSFVLGGLAFLIYFMDAHDDRFVVPVIITSVYLGTDLIAILARKSGRVTAPKLVYAVGKAAEFERIIKTAIGFVGIWLLSLGGTFVFAEDYHPALLRIIAVLAFNVVSFTMFRWLQEVRGIITEYLVGSPTNRNVSMASSLLSASTPHTPSVTLSANLRPFTPLNAGQAAPQAIQPQSISVGIGKRAQP